MAVKRRSMEVGELDLVPVMNLVTILIPFLLMSMQLMSLAVIDSTLPAISSEPVEQEEDDEDKPLNMSILLTEEGFTVTGADKVLAEEEGGPGAKLECKEVGCPTADSYDFAELKARLHKVKDVYDQERDANVILVPDSTIPYEALVLTMDAARDDPEVLDADGKARILFPYVVIAGGVE
jgi:biopolymer transport protein ExbD